MRRDIKHYYTGLIIGLSFLAFFIITFLISRFLIYHIASKQTIDYLQQITKRVHEDIHYKNGKWDTSRYNADPNVPDTYPLYILSSDGFVIDRWKPLRGFLDTSDIKHLLFYQTPQTITTPTNQAWRILSKPLPNQGGTIGVITVAYFNPSQSAMSDIDQKLQDSIAIIQSKITITKNKIDTTMLDTRDVSFDVTFQVVDKFNTIITKSNNSNSIDRFPNYIDTSYIADIVNADPIQIVEDTRTHQKFLLVTTPIFDSANSIAGVIVVGRSIDYIYQILFGFTIAELIVGSSIAVLFAFFTAKLINKYRSYFHKKPIEHISFDKKAGVLRFDDQEVSIPYATNQYYLCEALFSSAKKRWEVDELLERFGEQDLSNSRKVYDCMLLINKKASGIIDGKLIVLMDKTYQINPLLLSKIV